MYCSGLPLRPVVLFSSVGDLIELYWSGAGQEKTTLLEVRLNIPGYPRIHLDSPGYTRIHQDTPGYTRIHQDTPRYTRIHQDTP